MVVPGILDPLLKQEASPLVGKPGLPVRRWAAAAGFRQGSASGVGISARRAGTPASPSAFPMPASMQANDCHPFRHGRNEVSGSGACNPPQPSYCHAMILSAVITPAEEGGFVALNPETGTTSQGETIDEAIESLREAVILYLEEFPMQVARASVMTSFEVAHA